MELFERRAYYFCRHCGNFHFLDAAPVDGLQILGRSAEPHACPVCRAPLSRSLLDREHSVEACEHCRGVLMPRRSFADIVTRRRAWATDPPTQPVPLDPKELERRLTCPSCGTRMDVHPYYGPGNVVIDSCTGCNALWLDFGELQQIVDAPGRDRGTRQTPMPAAEPDDTSDEPESWRGRRRLSVIDLLEDLL